MEVPSVGGLTRKRLLVVAVATATGPLSIDLYLPAFPELARDLNTSEAAVQITLTACVIGLALGQLVAGPLSDTWGRRTPLLVGLLGWSATSALCALAPSIQTFTALRFAQGLAGAAGLVVSRAVVRDLAAGHEMVRAFARLMLIVGVVPVAAPTFGGLMLKVVPWQGLFLVLATFGLVSALAVLIGLSETLPRSRRRSGGLRSAVRSYRLLLGDLRFVRSALVLAFAFAALFVYVSVSAFAMRNVFGLDAAAYGLIFAAHAVALVAGNQVSGRTAGRWQPSRQLLVALGVAVLGAAALSVAAVADVGGLPLAIGSVVVSVFGIGMSLPLASTITMADHPERAGAASALLGLLQFSVGGVIAPFVASLGSATLVPLAVSMSLCLLTSMALLTAGAAVTRLRQAGLLGGVRLPSRRASLEPATASATTVDQALAHRSPVGARHVPREVPSRPVPPERIARRRPSSRRWAGRSETGPGQVTGAEHSPPASCGHGDY